MAAEEGSERRAGRPAPTLYRPQPPDSLARVAVRSAGALALRQPCELAGPSEHAVGHRLRELPRERVLLARVKTADERPTLARQLGPVAEARPRPGYRL